MSRQELVNGDAGLSFRNKANDNFEELYGFQSTGLLYLGILSVPGDGIPATRPGGGSYEAGDYWLITVAGTYSTVACEQYDSLILNENESTWEACRRPERNNPIQHGFRKVYFSI